MTQTEDKEGLISEKKEDIIEKKKVVAKKQKNEIKPDAVLKEYWRNNDRFTDLFNQVLFEGKQVIKAEDLEEVDTERFLSLGMDEENIKKMLSRNIIL